MYCMGRDITERKLAEQALNESEQKYRALVEQANDGIAVIQDEKIVFANKRFTEMTGRTFVGLLDTPFNDYITAEELPNIVDMYRKRMDDETPSISETVIQRKDGSRVEVEFSAGLTAYAGKPAVLVIVRDITDRKLAEQQILEYQERLKALASQLTIVEERERRRIAAELHDHVSQSLAFARMRLASASKRSSDPKLLAILDDISESLLVAIQDTMVLIFNLSPPLLNEIGLGAAIYEWLDLEVEKKHGLKTEFINHSSDFKLDEDVRAILFRNVRELLTNVVRHAGASQVSVHLEAAGDKINVIVEDDGVGFDPDTVTQETKREVGFGLFSIQERMSDMGGAFVTESEPGHGCKAILSMPLSS